MNKISGFSFIEVLVALVIIVTGIFGAVAMQTTAKKGSFDAMQRSQASALAQDIIERMRSNQSLPAMLENYEGSYGNVALGVPDNDCRTLATPCSAQQLVTRDLYEWTEALRGASVKKGAKNRGGLINATGCISHANNAISVTISWRGKAKTKDGTADNDIARDCGTADAYRRQLFVNAFIL